MRALANSCAFPLNLEVDTTDSLTAVAGHVCVSYRGCLICWGGYCYDEREIHYRETNWLYIFPYMLCGAKNNVWLKIQCETDLQLRPNSGATANVHQDQLYIFGGCLFDDLHRRMINTSMLIAIDLRTGVLRAKQNPPNGCIPTPRDKTTSWIADEKFFIFGGYGMSWHRLDHGHEYFFQPWSFLDDDMGSCWNNQLLYYDLKNECWQEVNQKGTKPSQRAAAASAFVPQLNQVFLFGGRHDQTRLNDLYMLDMASFIWTQIDAPTSIPNNSIQIPAGRSWCTMVHLNEQKKILCYGGLCSNGEPLGDLWELDISEFYEQKNELKINEMQQQKSIQLKRPYWRLIPPMEHQLPNRLWHCSVLMHNEAILIYGGMNESPASDSPFVRTLLVKSLQPPSLRQLALNALTQQILERWMAEMGGTFRNSLKSPNCGQIPPPLPLQVDLQFFANATGFMSFLPHSLHPHIRILLSIQKHEKSLKPSGGTTPRANSPFHWQPTPSNFHLLNLDGIQREVEEGQNSLNTLGFSRSNHWNVPLSPKSQKRSLADELFKHICENAKSRGSPFLEALFHSFDPL